jgi:hypothetical protein
MSSCGYLTRIEKFTLLCIYDKHWRKTSAGSSEVSSLALVKARGDQLDHAVVDVSSVIELEICLGAIYLEAAFARRYQRLGHILAAGYFVPYSARKFVAAIGSFAAVACGKA